MLAQAEKCVSCFFLTEDEDDCKVNNLVRHLTRYGTELPTYLKEKADRGEVRKYSLSDSDLNWHCYTKTQGFTFKETLIP